MTAWFTFAGARPTERARLCKGFAAREATPSNTASMTVRLEGVSHPQVGAWMAGRFAGVRAEGSSLGRRKEGCSAGMQGQESVGRNPTR